MKTRFRFSVSEPADAILRTVGAVIGYDFLHKPASLTETADQGEVLVDNENFWFMKSILERLESKSLISFVSWEVAS